MKTIFYNQGGKDEATSARDIALLSRRGFVRRSSLFLPLAWFSASQLLRPQRAAANSSIISRTISAANQNAISMSNATWARPVTIPAAWSKIRLGCRLHWTNTAASLTGGPVFTMGFNSGTAAQYGDASCQNFGGYALDAATWNYNAGGSTYYNLGNTNQVWRTRVGTTNTDVSGLNAGMYFNAGAATNSADRMILFFDITKGSPYTVKLPFTNTIAQPDDVSATNFLTYMGQLAPVPGGNYGAASSSFNMVVDEVTNGTWNAINFYWNRTDVTIEICDVAVAVLA